ncbi:MAG: hypothetical protein AB1481_00030 [Candidatus Omnitrophota bacterium]
MISIDFSFAIASYLFIFFIIILFIWLFNKKGKGRDLSLDPKFIWHCSICTYSYINTKEEEISVCPRCGSYNKKS